MEILIDSRERNPLAFAYANCQIRRQKLDCGDYTTELLKDTLRIERKASSGELYLNLSSNKERERFHKELFLLSKFPCALICCEFPERFLYCFPHGSNIPPDRWKFLRMSPKYFRKMVYEIEQKYNIGVLFFEDKFESESFILQLMERLEKEKGATL